MTDDKIDPAGSPYMTVDEAAEYLRVLPRTIRSFLRDGELKAWRAGENKRVVVRRSDLDGLMHPVDYTEDDEPELPGDDGSETVG